MAIGPMQIVIILVLALLLFGAGRLAEVGKGLGQGIRNFKKGVSGEDEEDEPRVSAKSEDAEKRET